MATANWYAIKVFYNRLKLIQTRLGQAGVPFYCPMKADGKPLVSSLIFAYCSEDQVRRFKFDNNELLMVYTKKSSQSRTLRSIETGEMLVEGEGLVVNRPAPIREVEMKRFMAVCNLKMGLNADGTPIDPVEVLGPDDPKYHVGELVRVKNGPYKDAVGYIKRIKKDRRLIVCIEGVIAVATMHIDPKDTEPIEEENN